MQSHRRMRLLLWAIALLVFVGGTNCSLVTRAFQKTPAVELPGSVPPDVEMPGYVTPTGGSPYFGDPIPAQEGTVEIDLGLRQFTSYRARLVVTFKGDDSPPGQVDASIDLLQEVDRAAQAFHEDAVLMMSRNIPPAGEDLYEIGSMQYMITWSDLYRGEKTGCLANEFVPSPQAVHAGFSNYMSGIRLGEKLGEGEVINGIETDRYRVTGANFLQAENEQVSGEVWLARDGGYIVQASGQVEADVTSDVTIHGRGEWRFALEEINTTSITLPPECLAQGQESAALPLAPGAENYSSSQDSFTYTTQMSSEEVAEFYRKELPPLGFAIEEQGNAGGMLMWSVSRGEETYLLSITPSNAMTVVNVGRLR